MLMSMSVLAEPVRSLPDAPLPQRPQQESAILNLPAYFVAVSAAQNPGANSRSGPEPPPGPSVTMFPHPDSVPWLLGGQANIIFQAHGGFHSPYSGPHSFLGGGEYKTSLLGTFYSGYAWHMNSRFDTDFIVDLEAAGGRGLSEALGLAGFTNLDVVRNPNLGSAPYLARGEIHQTIGLSSAMTEQERGPFALATAVPVRRIEVRVGKMSVPDQFDVNSVGSDSHLQFMNWTVDNNGAWDYAADTRGYTVGGSIEYDDHNWAFRYGIFSMPTVANGIDLDWAWSRAHGQNWEADWYGSLIHGRRGATRILAYANNAHMGNYRQTVVDYLDGLTPTPEITFTEKFGALKYGFGWNDEQEITDHLRLYSRFGWDDGKTESFAYTEDDQTVQIGGDYNGAQWGRPVDKMGLVFVSNAIKKDHQRYLALGGLGFILGDGALTYGRENIEEYYYNLHAWKGMYFAFDEQHIDDPGYNRARGPVFVESVRAHVDC
jgi:high affinity Mn2+ porin